MTFHLADSLPKNVVERLEREINAFPLENQDIERRKRIEIWIDAGYGPCALREPFVAAMVQESLLHFDGQRYRLREWVVMPNHVHVLFQPINGWTVAKIVSSWKKFTARRICDYRKTMNADREIGVPGEIPAFWHREYWDCFIRNDLHCREAIEYIHENPVKAGLVVTVKDWPWSSAAMPQSKK